MGRNVIPLDVATSLDFEEAPCRGCRRSVPITIDAQKYLRHDAMSGDE